MQGWEEGQESHYIQPSNLSSALGNWHKTYHLDLILVVNNVF